MKTFVQFFSSVNMLLTLIILPTSEENAASGLNLLPPTVPIPPLLALTQYPD